MDEASNLRIEVCWGADAVVNLKTAKALNITIAPSVGRGQLIHEPDAQ